MAYVDGDYTVVVEDIEVNDGSTLEVAHNYWNFSKENAFPVFVATRNSDGDEVLLGLNIEQATKIRDGLSRILYQYIALTDD